MKGLQIILGHIGPAQVAMRMVDGRPDDVFVEDMGELPVGSICRATVDRAVKGIGGVFVTLPGGTGFLRKAKGLAPGQCITVQVTGRAEDGKATPVTSRILFKSRYAIVTPDAPGLNISRQIKGDDLRDDLDVLAKTAMEGADMGLILRSACAGADMGDIAEDIEDMRELAMQVMADTGNTPQVLVEGAGPHALAWREWHDASDVLTGRGDLEATGALDALEQAQMPRQPIAGGYAFIEPTRALVAVDVNTGNDTSPAAALKCNLALAADLPRLLRLRGLAGQITVDLAPVMKRDRKQIETAFRAACRRCAVETEVIGWTPLGHLELKRKRERCVVEQVLKP